MWVTQYNISLSMDNTNWTFYQEDGTVKMFVGNTDQTTIKKNTLTQPLARYIRFIPTAFQHYKVMRVGIYGYLQGCENLPLGMESGAIPDGNITASSAQHPAKNARLHYTSGSSWCASTSDSHPYLQIDLGLFQLICAVATQGNSQADQWVKTYQIDTSTDGSTWTTYQENNNDRIFYGNYDRSTVARRVLYHGVVTRYLRILPKTYQTNTPCLRTEIFGYPYQTSCSSHSVGIPSTSLVPDHRFTATATSIHGDRKPYRGRLGGATSWAADSRDNHDDYLQVDLGAMFYICAVATQGAGENVQEWVTKYKVLYSTSNITWTTYSTSSGEKEFNGNTDRNTVVTNTITNPFRARFVRVRPTAVQQWKMLRMEFKGLPLDCTSSLGLENSQIPDSQITSSSFWTAGNGVEHLAIKGRLYGSLSWCSGTNDNTEYIQVDLGQVKTVTGIATQGNPSFDAWVTSYKMKYSFDNTHWNGYREGQVVKTLAGNTNRNDVRVNWLRQPIAARYVRIHPQTHNSGGRQCLRFDLYGCDFFVAPKVVLDTADLTLPSIKGSSRTLTCSVLGEPAPDIQWFNNGTKIDGETQSTLPVQFISAEDVVSKYNCTRQDPNTRAVVCNTFYTCRVVNPVYLPSGGIKETAPAKVTVFLNVPKTFSLIITMRRNKRSITLNWPAMIASNDVGTIIWYTIQVYNQASIKTYTVRHPASNYTIDTMKPYSIRINAISTVGQGVWSSWLNATTMIADPTEYSNSTIWALKGEEVTLGCYVSGDEPIKYTWRKSEARSLDNFTARTRGSDLIVTLKSDKDFGTYVCNASNGEETVVYRINRVELKEYMTWKLGTCESSESKAKQALPYVLPLTLIILALIICLVYVAYRLRKERQKCEIIMKKLKSKTDEIEITDKVRDISNYQEDVIKNSRKPKAAKDDVIENPHYMELRRSQSSEMNYQSIQEPAHRPGEREASNTQIMMGNEQYMDLKPEETNTEYETLNRMKSASRQDYQHFNKNIFSNATEA